ncbi:MAG: anti-sigma factor antagonist [Lachnospiraceae bacterium]
MDQKEVSYEITENIMIIHLPSEVDDHSCQNIREDTEKILREKQIKQIVFDFSRTGFMDSAGIGALLGRYKRMKELGGEVVLYGEDSRVKRILKISGIYQIMRSI